MTKKEREKCPVNAGLINYSSGRWQALCDSPLQLRTASRNPSVVQVAFLQLPVENVRYQENPASVWQKNPQTNKQEKPKETQQQNNDEETKE